MHTWLRQQDDSLLHQGKDQPYNLAPTVGGYCLLGLATGDVWYIRKFKEETAKRSAEDIIYFE